MRNNSSSNNSTNTTPLWQILAGAGAGAALMYFLDPDRGERRRSLLTDQISSAAHQLPEAVRTTSEDLRNRAYGFYAEARDYFSSDEDVADQVVEARVRSALGRLVSHPSAIHVMAQEGRVALRGQVLADEVANLLDGVRAVKGVERIENNLKVYQSPGDIPALQGDSSVPAQFEYFQDNWSPAARFLAGLLGGAALIYGLTKKDSLSLGAGTIGLVLLTRSATNLRFDRLTGFDAGRQAVTVHKAINVDASPEQVFRLWANFENFPKFMSNVLEVKDFGDGRSRWTVSGLAGITADWNARITKVIDNELIAWKSIRGSQLPNSGIVQFIPAGDGKTQVDVQLSYNPPGGAIGHAVATMFGVDPKTQMDEDLMRMKTLIETGERPHDAAEKPDEKSRSKTA